MTQQEMTKVMDDFFATHSYNEQDDWRVTSETADDPIDEDEES